MGNTPSSSSSSSNNDSSASSSDDEEVGAAATIIIGASSAANTVAQTIKAPFDFQDSDTEDPDDQAKSSAWGGSKAGKAPNKQRDFELANSLLVKYYFSGEESLYSEADFEQRFGVPRVVFNRVFERLNGTGVFQHQYNKVTKKMGIYPLVRMVACFRKLCYGDSSNRQDEFLQISESAVDVSFKEFCRRVVDEFGAAYLNRCPSKEEKSNSIKKMKQRGFPGCFASWDCKHFVWGNCPVRLAGKHIGKAECIMCHPVSLLMFPPVSLFASSLDCR